MQSSNQKRKPKVSTKARAQSAARRRRFRNLQKRRGKANAYTMCRLAPGARYEPVDQKVIFERDNWTCKLCGLPVNRLAKFPHPESPTLDHITPVTRGGHHTRCNVQCAHSRCNLRKAKKVPFVPPELPLMDWEEFGRRFGGVDLSGSLRWIESHWNIAEELIELNADALGRRKLDRFMLSIVHLTVCGASITANERSRIEECGTLGCQGMLAYFLGADANGTVIRVAREILVRMGLILRIDESWERRTGERPGQCQRWVPTGASWSLPFLKRLNDAELTSAQFMYRTVYLAAQATREEREEAAAQREASLKARKQTNIKNEGTGVVERDHGSHQKVGGRAGDRTLRCETDRLAIPSVSGRGGTARLKVGEERTASLPVRFGPPIGEDRDWSEIEGEGDSPLCVCDLDGNTWYVDQMDFAEDYMDILGNLHRAWVPEAC